jgi:hypothetical protein
MGVPDTLVHWDFDTVVIADLSQGRKLRAQLLACGIPAHKLITL